MISRGLDSHINIKTMTKILFSHQPSMTALWIAVAILSIINVVLVMYFISTFERIMLVMKASSLTDLIRYQAKSKLPPNKIIKDEDDDMI